MSFEELGPTFVKLGQLLATRPDLVPEDYIVEFEKLHDRVQPLPFSRIEDILNEEFGEERHAIFASVDPEPLGSASIAQVHRARLRGGQDVVIKVQRPGILETISDDLNVLYMLAELLQRYVPETRPYDPVAIVNEFFKTLELETNFIVEANNIRRFAENFAPEDNPANVKVKIPHVHMDLTTERILVMEAVPGIPLSHDEALQQPGVDPQEIVRIGLRTYLKMVFIDGLFHGDLHAGNFFVMPGNRIGLIDFGVVGRLNPKTQSSIINMLLALSKEDYERLALEYVDLAPFTDRVNVDLFGRELRELIAPFFGLTLKNVNLGKILMGSSSIAARHHLAVPTELMMFFKSIVAIEGLGRRIDKNFDFLKTALEFAGELAKHQMEPQRLFSDVTQTLRESRNLIQALPRQLSFFIRKMNAPDYANRIEIRGLDDVKRAIEISFNLLFLGVIISALIVSASLLFAFPGNLRTILGMPMPSFIMYLSAGLLGVLGFFNYIRKS
ncbi:MAG: AarF/ABC1/UbiB kinase family protein [Bdellovibrionaceae bacterium]|nr:AarF/ABC1/UbiB kinase family protein [Pseudobdellovibrionaceae bacterium]MBX3032699.1 AarF/ABC1/UbiB kinase family protein [Pseudobdellovibrionaceae bacterium]